jgi:hypothetical protein
MDDGQQMGYGQLTFQFQSGCAFIVERKNFRIDRKFLYFFVKFTNL